MRVIQPVPLSDSNLTSTNVPEADHAVWLVGTAYTAGQRVIVTTGDHSIYEAVVNNTGFNPATDTTGKWARVGATNRWKAFDKVLGDPTVKSGLIEYVVTLPGTCQAVAAFNLVASTFAVRVTDATLGVLYDETYNLVETIEVVDWFSYFFEDIAYKPEFIINNLPAYAGSTVRFQIDSPGTTQVGELVFGYDRYLGENLVQPRIGIEDYSVKEVDEFGRATLIQRTFSDRAEFGISIDGSNSQKVKRTLAALRATPAVYYVDVDTDRLGTTIYGYYTDFSIVLNTTEHSIMTLTLEGLV